MNLTPKQRYGLQRLADLQKEHGFQRWTTIHIGQSDARALRSLDGTPLVDIDARQTNMYYYSITDAGRAALSAKDLPPTTSDPAEVDHEAEACGVQQQSNPFSPYHADLLQNGSSEGTCSEQRLPPPIDERDLKETKVCLACSGTRRLGPYFPGGMSAVCANCTLTASEEASS